MRIYLNELSLVGQAASPNIVRGLLLGFIATTNVFEPLRAWNRAALFRHSNLLFREMVTGEPLCQSLHHQGADVRRRFLLVLDRSIQLAPADFFEAFLICLGLDDISDSAAAAAAKANGFLASFTNAPTFASQTLSLSKVCATTNTTEVLNLQNVTTAETAALLVPRYEPHPKHTTPWKGASFMDLSALAAQDALNGSVLRPNGKQRYSKFQGRYYEFQPSGGASPNVYHGYIIPEGDVPAAVRALLDVP